jgi:hypothetical protein
VGVNLESFIESLYKSKIKYVLILISLLITLFRLYLLFTDQQPAVLSNFLIGLSFELLFSFSVLWFALVVFTPKPEVVRQTWKVVVLGFLISFVGENAGVMLGLWDFTMDSFFPTPVAVNISYAFGVPALLYIVDWVYRGKNIQLKKWFYLLIILFFSLVGMGTDWMSWLNGNFIIAEGVHPLLGVALWFTGFCMVSLYSRKLVS